MLLPTPEQAAALDKIEAWLTDSFMRKHEFVLAGLAGTGKTTMMKLLPERVEEFFLRFLAPTNKAASVLRSKGIAAETIHREFYRLVEQNADGRPEFEFNGSHADARHLYVIDEASMIDADMLADLRSTDASFLFVGDHGQLPPVGRDPLLMQNADVKLETILRQAADNEILTFAHHLREGGDPFEFVAQSRDVVIPPPGLKLRKRPSVDMWLCWRNFTRVQLNMWMIEETTPAGVSRPSSVPVQIRGNYPEQGLYNGEVYVATNVTWDQQTGHPRFADLGDEGGTIMPVRFHPKQWHREKRVAFNTDFENGVLADYGFAITVHTSQGSEWDRIVVVDEVPPEDAARWRYTAATRARKQVLWIPPQALPIAYPSEVF